MSGEGMPFMMSMPPPTAEHPMVRLVSVILGAARGDVTLDPLKLRLITDGIWAAEAVENEETHDRLVVATILLLGEIAKKANAEPKLTEKQQEDFDRLKNNMESCAVVRTCVSKEKQANDGDDLQFMFSGSTGNKENKIDFDAANYQAGLKEMRNNGYAQVRCDSQERYLKAYLLACELGVLDEGVKITISEKRQTLEDYQKGQAKYKETLKK